MRIERFAEIDRRSLLMRDSETVSLAAPVSKIIQDVAQRGDDAVLEYTARFDGVQLEALEVPREELEAAAATLDPALRKAMDTAAANIRAFHEKQKREGFCMDCGDGVYMGQFITPIERVGLYIPGGTAAYPSTVFMNTIPAKIAGCSEIVMVSPPGKDGSIPKAILAAASIAGVTHVFRNG